MENAYREVSEGNGRTESITASVDVLCYGMFVHQVLVNILQHELVYDGRHAGLQERSQIQLRLAIELVVNDLIRGLSIDTL